jgi:hypothetical protein
MAPNRVTSQASAKGRDTPDHAEVLSSRSLFEVGKTYRMTGGGTATITERKKAHLIGYTTSHQPYVRVWGFDGVFSPGARQFTLIPNRGI